MTWPGNAQLPLSPIALVQATYDGLKTMISELWEEYAEDKIYAFGLFLYAEGSRGFSVYLKTEKALNGLANRWACLGPELGTSDALAKQILALANRLEVLYEAAEAEDASTHDLDGVSTIMVEAYAEALHLLRENGLFAPDCCLEFDGDMFLEEKIAWVQTLNPTELANAVEQQIRRHYS